MKRHGQQEDWNLNHILLHPEERAATEAILGANTVFDLAALLVDRNGVNLRTGVAHGLMEDGGLEGGLSRHLFWLCLRLCMTPLLLQAEKVRQARQQNGAPDEPEPDHHETRRGTGDADGQSGVRGRPGRAGGQPDDGGQFEGA